MNISIIGGDAEQAELCSLYAGYTLKKLCGKRLYDVIEIDVSINANLHADYGQTGNCGAISGDYFPRAFDIELDGTLSQKELLITLGHELVHVKQIAKGELRHLDSGITKWKMKSFENLPATPFHYNMLPWELEAAGLEKFLFADWAITQQIDYKWYNT